MTGIAIVIACSGKLSAESVQIVISDKMPSAGQNIAEDMAEILEEIYPENTFTVQSELPREGAIILLATRAHSNELLKLTDLPSLQQPGEFVVGNDQDGTRRYGYIYGEDLQAMKDGVYTFLETGLGYAFYLTHNADAGLTQESFTFDNWDLRDYPLVQTRGVLNWHNFLTSASTWDVDDWKKYIRQSARMRYTDLIIHCYGNNPMIEFDYLGKTKPVGYLSTSRFGRDWSVEHVWDVRNLIGGELFDGPIFGADFGMEPGDDYVGSTKQAMREVFDYAQDEWGMGLIFQYDVDTISANPQNIITQLPESARFLDARSGFWMARPDTPEGFAYYKRIVKQLMEDYPSITELVAWVRPEIKQEWIILHSGDEIPKAWRGQVKEILETYPHVDEQRAAKAVFVGHLTRCWRQALDELGYEHVEIGMGTWLNVKTFEANHITCDPSVAFHVLDASVAVSDNKDYARRMKPIGEIRDTIMYEWPQNDNHGMFGRPADPPTAFGTNLTETTGSKGFAILHWNTRPLDLYFKNLINATWAGTQDETIEQSIQKMSLDFFGPELEKQGTEFLANWMANGPIFGNESTAYLDGRGQWQSYRKQIQHSQERIAILEGMLQTDPPDEVRERLDYFLAQEEFYQAIWTDNRWRYERKGAASDRATPEATIQLYADMISDSNLTPGELGLLVNLNIKWLSYYLQTRQLAGEYPFMANFQPTNHDPFAQSCSDNTFFVDEDGQYWAGLGEQETGLQAYYDASLSDDDMLNTYIQADSNVLELSLGDLYREAQIPSSRGTVELYFPPVENAPQSMEVIIEGHSHGVITAGEPSYRFEAIEVADGLLDIQLISESESPSISAVSYSVQDRFMTSVR